MGELLGKKKNKPLLTKTITNARLTLNNETNSLLKTAVYIYLCFICEAIISDGQKNLVCIGSDQVIFFWESVWKDFGLQHVF